MYRLFSRTITDINLKFSNVKWYKWLASHSVRYCDFLKAEICTIPISFYLMQENILCKESSTKVSENIKKIYSALKIISQIGHLI